MRTIIKTIFQPILFVVVALALVVSQPMSVVALDEQFFSGNDILFFAPGVDCIPSEDGDNTECCATGDTLEVASVDANGSNAEKLFVFLVSKGLTANQAAGFVGNVMQESGGGTFNLDPNALNPGSGAFGIVQWYQGRKDALEKYARDQGKPINDFNMQMDFLWVELTGDFYKPRVLDPLKATNDLKEITRIVLEDFEVPCLAGSAECSEELNGIRLPNARKVLAAFGNVSPGDVNIGTCSSGSASGDVNAEGMSFPLGLTKDKIDYLPCNKRTCHHDGTPASDMFAPVGTPAFAIEDGSIQSLSDYYDDVRGCYSIQFKGKSGWVYWYGHIKSPAVSEGQRNIKAGEKLAEVGESKCAKGTDPHLHIDRGAPKGRSGGEDCCRDPNFVQVLNKLFEGLSS